MINSMLIFGLAPAFLSFNIGLVGDVNSLKSLQSQYVTKMDVMPLTRGIDEIRDAIQQNRVGNLKDQMYNLRVRQCDAIKQGNLEAARSHDQQLQNLEFEWRSLMKYDYSRRPCSEL